MARRCFSPPERVLVARSSKPPRPTSASASGTRARISGLGQPRFSSPKRDLVVHPGHDELAVRILEDEPDPFAQKARRRARDIQTADAEAARPSTRQGMGHEPRQGARQGALART